MSSSSNPNPNPAPAWWFTTSRPRRDSGVSFDSPRPSISSMTEPSTVVFGNSPRPSISTASSSPSTSTSTPRPSTSTAASTSPSILSPRAVQNQRPSPLPSPASSSSSVKGKTPSTPKGEFAQIGPRVRSGWASGASSGAFVYTPYVGSGGEEQEEEDKNVKEGGDALARVTAGLVESEEKNMQKRKEKEKEKKGLKKVIEKVGKEVKGYVFVRPEGGE